MDNNNLFKKRLDRIRDLNSECEASKTTWLIRFRPIEAVIQNGPQCGIVALVMALKQMNLTVTSDELMLKARQMNFTKSGEIFDATYLNSLAKSYSDSCSLERLESEQDECRLFDSLVDNKQVIIAYDCDFNFEPAFKQGKKAHWALITGIYAPIQADDMNSKECCEDSCASTQERSIVDINSLSTSRQQDLIDRLKGSFRDKKLSSASVYCIGKQGKSSQYGVWSWKDLVASNRQLSQIDDDKLADDDMFIKPADRDLKRTLASQYIVFN